MESEKDERRALVESLACENQASEFSSCSGNCFLDSGCQRISADRRVLRPLARGSGLVDRLVIGVLNFEHGS
jgi:hypothetical protein